MIATAVIMIGAAILLITWDIYAATNRKPGDTISEVLLTTGKRVAGLPFVFGVIAAHLFLPGVESVVEMPWAAIILGITSIVVTVAGMLIRRMWSQFPVTWPALALGIVSGLVLWSQS